MPKPNGAQGANSPAGNPSHDSSSDILVRIASTGPMWLRGLALTALIVTTATPYTQRFIDYLDDQQANKIMQTTTAIAPSDQIYKGGKAMSAPVDAHVMVSNALSPDDALHLSEHTSKRMENPPFKRFPVTDKKGVIAYSVYPSDGCILINHIQNGYIKTDLVRAEEQAAKGSFLKPTGGRDDSLLHTWGTPSLMLDVDWEKPSDLSNKGTEQDAVQGSCMNPHPGQFNYWTVPVNECIEQVFRRFGDGCTHYQMHNKCNNGWDPAINWTFCNGQHAR